MEPFDLEKMTDVQLYLLKQAVGDAKDLLKSVLEQYEVTSLDQLKASQAYDVIKKAQEIKRSKKA